MISQKNLLAAGVMLTLALPLAAQVSGRLTGRVADPSGAGVPEATVHLRLAGGSRTILTAQTTLETSNAEVAVTMTDQLLRPWAITWLSKRRVTA